MTVTLKSKDGKEFQISEESCNISKYLKEKTKDKKELVLDEVSGEALALIIIVKMNYQNYLKN